MTSLLRLSLTAIAISALLASCKKNNDLFVTPGPPTSASDTAGTLKDAATFPLGIAIEYALFKSDAAYRSTVIRQANNVTFGYHMKHGAIVRDDGTFNYAATDELFNLATNAGLTVFGHTLAWHQNQNGTYLRTLTAGTPNPGAPNIVVNGDFEAVVASTQNNWNVYNTNGATVSVGTASGEVHGGVRSLKIVNPNDNPGSQWKVQIGSDLFNTTINTSYKVSFWIKATAAGGTGRLSTQPTAQYQNDFNTTTDWTQITWTFSARDAQTRILFDMGAVANTYYIDDVTVTDASSVVPPNTAQVAAAVDTALSRFIRSSVTRYAGKIKAWDVVNEPMADGASGLRTRTNSSVTAGATDYFFWSEYLGRDYALKAFNYAKTADPNALLFINDYNLESNNAKLDSLLYYIKELQTKGAKIDGIGTQMHIGINNSTSGIETMFQKLAATGLKVRVSELDVRINPNNTVGFTPTAALLQSQADMYKYVVQSFIRNVPAAQRHGITIWGVTDKDSWIVNALQKTDSPLLFNSDYSKKPAFYSLLLGLKGK
ncbi:MAG: endo,4-beta-xylanase precursor [Segetibacter sp.]|nr:endo,4-beta-xylanase precursor [Segetibacter sp.]